jgi:hypothetical protein
LDLEDPMPRVRARHTIVVIGDHVFHVDQARSFPGSVPPEVAARTDLLEILDDDGHPLPMGLTADGTLRPGEGEGQDEGEGEGQGPAQDPSDPDLGDGSGTPGATDGTDDVTDDTLDPGGSEDEDDSATKHVTLLTVPDEDTEDEGGGEADPFGDAPNAGEREETGPDHAPPPAQAPAPRAGRGGRGNRR